MTTDQIIAKLAASDDTDLSDVVLNIAVAAADEGSSGADIAQVVYDQLAYLGIVINFH